MSSHTPLTTVWPSKCGEDLSPVSCPQVLTSPTHLAQVLSVVVNIERGVVVGIVWDNNCDVKNIISSINFEMNDEYNSIRS